MNAITEEQVRALGVGINLTALRKRVPELEAACNAKMEASEAFADVIAVAAIESGVIKGVLAQYITSRCNDTVRKKAISAAQLSLLFDEIDDGQRKG